MSSSSSSIPSHPLDLTLALSAPDHMPDTLNLDLSLALPYTASEPAIPVPVPVPVQRNLPLENVQWDIKKALTESDVGNHSRLLIPKHKANLILQKLSLDEQIQVRHPDGLPVKVLDVDTNREVVLTFKVLASSQAHVLNGQWNKGFVNMRTLERGNVIGLRYRRQPGEEEGKILFKVLRR